MQKRLPTPRWLPGSVLLGLLLALPACKRETGTPQQPAAATQAATPVPAVSSQVSAMPAEALREAAQKAIAEQRLYAPAGENAMEYYLALREKAPGDMAVSNALADIQPYTLIAAEQALVRQDLGEARRLYALLEKTDAAAPALPRLKQSIADTEAILARSERESAQADEGSRQAQMEQHRAEQQQLQQQAAEQLAAREAEERRLAELRAAEALAQQAAERRAASEAAAAARRQAEAQRAAPPPAEPAPAPVAAPEPEPVAPKPVANVELRPVSTPAPRYPAAALRSGRSGSVQVEFTVDVNGHVTSARVISATPPRLFNNETLSAVRRWRFQPIDQPVTSRRTITFQPSE